MLERCGRSDARAPGSEPGWDVSRNVVLFNQRAHEVEFGLRSAGKPTSISLKPTRTRPERSATCAPCPWARPGLIPSRRSTLHQMGAWSRVRKARRVRQTHRWRRRVLASSECHGQSPGPASAGDGHGPSQIRKTPPASAGEGFEFVVLRLTSGLSRAAKQQSERSRVVANNMASPNSVRKPAARQEQLATPAAATLVRLCVQASGRSFRPRHQPGPW